jgi:hypothetical protein
MGKSGVDSSKDRSHRLAAQWWNPGFYHTWGIPWLCEQLSTSRLKGLSKTTEASFMIDGLRTGIWKRSLRNISQETCLHVVMSHNINLDPQANLRSHTKVRPVLVTHTNRLRGLDWIASLQPISRTLYIHCVAALTGLLCHKAPFNLRKFPTLGLQRN